jgi:predicted O-linked N-acetylglucosamine transferase (SPINDLY family)
MRERLSKGFDNFLEVSKLSDLEIAQLARDLEIDIAIDLKGYTEDCRTGIFAYRCAPIQVNYLGYPGTMGVDYMDYVIADPVVIPESNANLFSEKIVYLPNCYQVNDSKRSISDKLFSRSDFGLPDDRFVFCCFNNGYKIQPRTFEIWMRILQAVNGSVLWLFEDNPTASANLRLEAKRNGVESERLIFANRLPIEEHLARHTLADLFLDTLPYNAHTTASDSLWAGLPVLTCMGESFASRVAASLLTAMELPELITTSANEYEEKAIKLATDSQMLSSFRERICKNKKSSALFNASLFARHLEMAFEKMHAIYQSDEPAANIIIRAH